MRTQQSIDALARANEIRLARAAERRALRGCSPSRLMTVLIDPSEPIASYKLCQLFAPTEGMGAIRGFRRAGLNRALARYDVAAGPRRAITAEHRLRDLTRAERQRVAAAILSEAPRAWREGERDAA